MTIDGQEIKPGARWRGPMGCVEVHRVANGQVYYLAWCGTDKMDGNLLRKPIGEFVEQAAKHYLRREDFEPGRL